MANGPIVKEKIKYSKRRSSSLFPQPTNRNLLLAKFEFRTVNSCKLSSKRRSLIYRTDQGNQANKTLIVCYISLEQEAGLSLTISQP